MKKTISLHRKDVVQIKRDENGIPIIIANSEEDMYYGQGFVQAMDRGMQMLLTRILGQGRGSEYLQSTEEMLKVDIFFRKMNWYGDIVEVFNKTNPETQKILNAFAEGIDAFFVKKLPWELKLLGYKYEKWQPWDTIMIMRMIGFISLQQSQGEIEHVLVELVKAGISKDLLNEVFPGQLEKLDVDLINKITLKDNIVPETVWQAGLPRMMASNNWVLAPQKSASGKAILSNDPHLETNRLPNVWQEFIMKVGDKSIAGASMPGIPGVSVGRTKNVAWGATYTFMDAIDSWVEECQGGKYKRVENGEEKWLDFEERKEVIKRKKKEDHIETFYENNHGALEGNPKEDGFYLSTKWASGSNTGAKSIEAFSQIFNAENVKDAMQLFKNIEVSFSWVFADKEGNIGYQMSGLMPKRIRDNNGLVPLPGWDPENDWQGIVDPDLLPSAYNPEEGYFITANNDLNKHGNVDAINMPMGSYRADRIEKLLTNKEKLTPDDMVNIQYDDYSLQAEKFMDILRPLLPDNENGMILRQWDCIYDLESKGAALFEKFYKALNIEVFGRELGTSTAEYMHSETGIFIDFYDKFDFILLAKNSLWFKGRTREEIYTSALNKMINEPVFKWKESQKILLKNILLGGKLPKVLGFDRGPVPIKGGRATPHQGQIYRNGGRETSFIASFRMVIDFADDFIRTNMCGGPSDRPFSKYYCSDLKNWLKGEYKKLRL